MCSEWAAYHKDRTAHNDNHCMCVCVYNIVFFGAVVVFLATVCMCVVHSTSTVIA